MPTLYIYDAAGTEIGKVEIPEQPPSGAEVTVPARLIKRDQRYTFAMATISGRVFRYSHPEPPRIERGKATFVLRLDHVGNMR